jgi:putative tryptophan/tyrosine transport system substrate-binding protein
MKPTTIRAIAALPGKPARLGILYAASPAFLSETDPTSRALVAGLRDQVMMSETMAKSLQLLKETLPGLKRVAVILWNPGVRGDTLQYREAEGVARALGLSLQSVEAVRAEDLDRAFSAITEQRAQALTVAGPSPVTFSNRVKIATFAQRNRLPSVYGGREFVYNGGLMSYGPSDRALFRRAAAYVDKILKRARPADLPIEQSTKFELVINLKTARVLGLTIPPSVLARADEGRPRDSLLRPRSRGLAPLGAMS